MDRESNKNVKIKKLKIYNKNLYNNINEAMYKNCGILIA